nr:uncharacterized protein LOC129280584 [Lytechinus pictus]
MTFHGVCPTFDIETGERHATTDLPTRRFKFTGAKTNNVSDNEVTQNGGQQAKQMPKTALLSDDDLGISTSSFKPRFPVAGTDSKVSPSKSSSNSKSFGSVQLSEVDGLPTTRLGRDGKFLGNYSHNFRSDEAKKDWWSPK